MSTASTFSTGATRVGIAVLASAAGLALLLGNVDAREPTIVDVVVVAGLALAGIASLVLASFFGPRPKWWTTEARRTAGSGADVLIGFAILVALAYGFWASPYLEEIAQEDPGALVTVVVGAVCVASAFRAARPGLIAALVAIGGGFLWIASGEAALLLGHGALTIALGCLLLAAFRAEAGWIRAACAVGTVVGFLAWVYYGFLVLFLYGCGTQGCFY